MLDFAAVVSRGGPVLWMASPSGSQPPAQTRALINALIVSRIIETTQAAPAAHGKGAASTFAHQEWTMQWAVENTHGLIFCIGFQSFLRLSFASALLDEFRAYFVNQFGAGIDALGASHAGLAGFAPIFGALLKRAEAESVTGLHKDSVYHKELIGGKTQTTAASKPKAFRDSRKYQDTLASSEERLGAAAGAGKGGHPSSGRLDYSADGPGSSASVSSSAAASQRQLEQFVDADTMRAIREGTFEIASMSVGAQPQKAKSWLASFFGSGGVTLDDASLDPLLRGIKERMSGKNVAAEVCEQICASVKQSLLGQTTAAAPGPLITEAVEAAIRRVLTPQTSTDLLLDIQEAQRERRVHSVVFVGVNGVGKSTNLAKVCFWLLQNKVRILIAACDTFRSGAVEQLRIHVRNLSQLFPQARIELFERGYDKDAAAIAGEALRHAAQNGFDAVMIDTAGRMQDNEPLMRALSKLVNVNQPDRIIFVGEALVGNEAIDQLTKFNAAIASGMGGGGGKGKPKAKRQIDGIILTKFDTVDQKVGAALSMTYITNRPIYFVGTGQTYTDLKRLNVSQIVDTLLS